MKEYFTAEEYAKMELQSFPTTKRGVNAIVEREGWNDHPAYARIRTGREGGGGFEYSYKTLPSLAQIDFTQKHMAVDETALVTIDTSYEIITDNNLSARAQKERDARMAIVHAFDRFSSGLTNLKQASHLQMFADKYKSGSIKIDEWIKEIVPSVSKRSLMRWRSAVHNGQSDKLAVDQSVSRRGTGILDVAQDGQVRAFILAMIAHQPFLSAKGVRKQCRFEFGDEVVVANGEIKEFPPVRNFQMFIKALKQAHKVELTKICNPDKFRSQMRLSGSNSLAHITRANQLWQVDASPIDALCVDGRWNIYACIDIATRRTCWLVSKTPRASAVALLIRKAILAWGVPDTIKTDNGSDFIAKDTKRLLSALGIVMELSDAYSPQQKGHVERVIKTFQHDCGPELPGFIGHNVADRKQIEERRSFAARLGTDNKKAFGVQLTGAEIQIEVDEWVEYSYHHSPHASLGNKTPFEVGNSLNFDQRTVDERALDILLMPVANGDGIRTVSKRGIRINSKYYSNFNFFATDRVFVRMDPADMGRALVFELDGGRYLGEAICPELAGICPKNYIKTQREMQNELVADSTAQTKKIMAELKNGPTLARRARTVDRADVEKKTANVVQLQPNRIEHTTPQIAAAKFAQGKTKAPTITDPAVLAEQKRIQDEIEQSARFDVLEQQIANRQFEIEDNRTAIATDKIAVLPESPKERYKRAVILEREGDPQRDKLELLWVGSYQTTPEYKAQKAMHEDFGDSYLQL